MRGVKIMTYTYKLKNLDCPNCAKKLEKAMQRVAGIKTANIVFMTQKLIVEADSDNEPYEALVKEAKHIMPAVEIEHCD